MDLIAALYAIYGESTEESEALQAAEDIKTRRIREICSPQDADALEEIILDYRCVSDVEKFAEGFRCAMLLCMQSLGVSI